MKRLVHLWDHAGIGLIIKCSTGVLYSNQTCGYCCLHSEQEGAFVPVGNDVAIPERTLISKEDELQAYFEGPPWHGSGAMSGLTEADSDFIDQLFANQPNLSFIKVDRNRLRESHEAWVHVLLHEASSPITQALGREGQLRTMTLAVFSGFGQPPLEAILTWANSD